jgi:hypothetical protein
MVFCEIAVSLAIISATPLPEIGCTSFTAIPYSIREITAEPDTYPSSHLWKPLQSKKTIVAIYSVL